MRNRIFLIAAVILASLFALTARETTSAQKAGAKPHVAAAASAPASAPAKTDCLGCHGPFDKLAEDTGKYTAPSGEKISPHRFVPHDSKKGEDIPECTNCHKAHPLDPLPAQGSVDLSKVNVQWCYDSCHHEKNFKSCKECHL